MSQTKPDPIVRWFRDAAPYINQHRGKTFVVYFSGEITEGDSFDTLIHDLGLLHALGIRLVLVYGARPQIEARLALEGIEPSYSQGLRITDAHTLDAVVEVAGRLRVVIEARLSLSLANTPMSGSRIRVCSGNFITAKPLGIRDGVDFQHTGEVRRVDTEAMQMQLGSGQTVLCSPLGYSPTGEIFNLRGEDVACQTAIALQADKLIFLCENGTPEDFPGQLSPADIPARLSTQSLHPDSAGLLQLAAEAASHGVARSHLLDRHIDGALLSELFTLDGCGTMVTGEHYENLRSATYEDVAGILELIRPMEEAGVLVQRSREQLELDIERFSVIERDGTIIACAALFAVPAEGVGELACLAVHPDYRRQQRGDLLLAHIESQARQQGLERLVVLSTQTMHWFIERGFQAGDIADLPTEKAPLYNYQRRSRICVKQL